jgi:hypothetical protein
MAECEAPLRQALQRAERTRSSRQRQKSIEAAREELTRIRHYFTVGQALGVLNLADLENVNALAELFLGVVRPSAQRRRAAGKRIQGRVET